MRPAVPATAMKSVSREFPFIDYMHDSQHGMAEKHPWPRITHDLPHLVAHILFIAMHFAFCTYRLIVPENTFVDPR